MLTIKEAIYQIKSLFHKEQIADDNGESDRWLYREILKYRSLLIRQKWEQRGFINQANFQEICFQLEERPIEECMCTVENNCTLFRSKHIIPKSIIPYDLVTNSDYSKEYFRNDTNISRFRKNTRYAAINKKGFFYTLDQGMGDYLFILSENPLLESGKVKSIFENPLDAQMYPDCAGNIKYPCRSGYDYEMKVDTDLFTIIKQMIIKDYGGMILQAPRDTFDNQDSRS